MPWSAFSVVVGAGTGEYARVDLDGVCAGFALGTVVDVAEVTGGLSNDMWHLWTDRGQYAIKAMVVNAGRPDFVTSLEGAFAVERRAWAAGVPMPEPIAVPRTGRCLLEVDSRLVRAHSWVEARAPDPAVHRVQVGTLLARVHAASQTNDLALDDEPWTVSQWRGLAGQAQAAPAVARQIHDGAQVLAALEALTCDGPGAAPTVNSHRDLDPKNVLAAPSGLLAVDWDAAGPVAAAREAVQVALDWSTEPAGFADVIAAYRDSSPHAVPAEPWVFGGWVSACAGWLAYNAATRPGTPLGAAEVATALSRLTMVSAQLPDYQKILRRVAG